MSRYNVGKKLILIIFELTLLKTFSCDFEDTMNQVWKSFSDCTDNKAKMFWPCFENESISILYKVEESAKNIPILGNSVELIRENSNGLEDYNTFAITPRLFKNRERKLSLRYGDLSFTRILMDFFKNRSLQLRIPILWSKTLWNSAVEGK